MAFIGLGRPATGIPNTAVGCSHWIPGEPPSEHLGESSESFGVLSPSLGKDGSPWKLCLCILWRPWRMSLPALLKQS